MIDKETGIEYGFIYKITNKINGKVYIGQTIDKLRRRWTTHLAVARKNPKWRLSKALVKYGEDAFTIEPLAFVEGAWLNYLESTYILIFDSMRTGYNMRMDGSRISHEVRKRMSDAHKGKPSNRKGAKNRPEHNEAARQARLGSTHSEETKAKMTAAHKARYLANPELFKKSDAQKELARVNQTGKRMSEETLARMSLAKIGKMKSEETKQKMRDSWKFRKPRPPITDEQRLHLSISIKAAWDRRKAAK